MKRPMNHDEYILKSPGMYGCKSAKLFVCQETGKAILAIHRIQGGEYIREHPTMTKARQVFAVRHHKQHLSLPSWVKSPG